jgi:hypothetical protein
MHHGQYHIRFVLTYRRYSTPSMLYLAINITNNINVTITKERKIKQTSVWT